MGTFPLKHLRQYAVYWGSPQPDGYGGYRYADPIEIRCRWETEIARESTADAERIISYESVSAAIEFDIGGVLWLGRLADLDSADLSADPLSISGARAIRSVEVIPAVRNPGRVFRRARL